MVSPMMSTPARAGDPDPDLAAVLSSHEVRRVTLVLSSCTELSGRRVAVEGRTATLAGPGGRERFDAVVHRTRTP
jgi:hypothetical protein